MKRNGDFWNRVALASDLPVESMPGVPLVEVIGDKRVLVENHRGVVAYGCNEIKVKVAYGFLCITGSGLQLACMSKQQLVIVGKLDCLSFECRRK